MNINRLASQLEFIADDHPQKLGHFLPGTTLSILPVSAIRKTRADLCLLGVMSEVEPKILERLEDFRRQGGEVVSIYPQSSLAPRSICQSELGPLSLS